MEAENDDDFQDKSSDYIFKMILTGDSMVGKTSVIHKYINDEFHEEMNRSR